MAKDKLTDYDSTASNNTDVGGISVAEGMLPSGVNNAIRELMSHQADAFGAGTPLYVDQTNNRVGIGNAAPTVPLDVTGATNVSGDLTVDTSTLKVDSTNNRVGIVNASPTTALDVTGDITLSGGLYLGGTGAANYLDDYEEGTWTPAFYGATSVTHDVQVGTYTKVGNLVYLEFVIGTSALSGSAYILIEGIPFTQDVSSNQVSARGEFEAIYLNYSSLSSIRYGLSFSSDRLAIRSDSSGSGNTQLSYSAVANASLFEIRGSITYRTSS